jgi:predicted nucleotidyltransferase
MLGSLAQDRMIVGVTRATSRIVLLEFPTPSTPTASADWLEPGGSNHEETPPAWDSAKFASDLHLDRMMQKKRQSMQMLHQSLASVLLPGYRRGVLGLLFLRPDESFHGREIARRTGFPAGSITRELRKLAEVGLLERESRGNQILYRANRASPVFEEVAGILRKTSGMADELARALAPLTDEISSAFVFGSMASGNQQQGSDVDVLVVGAVDFGSVVDTLYPLQKQLGREINPKVFSVAEWNAKIKAKSAFTTDVLGKPKLFLIGSENELAGLGRKKSGSRKAKR